MYTVTVHQTDQRQVIYLVYTCIIKFISSWLQLMSDYFIYRKEWLPMRGSLIGGGGKKIINVDRDVFKEIKKCTKDEYGNFTSQG